MLYTLLVGLEHLQSNVEFEATGNIVFQVESPTVFKVWSLQPFKSIWTVIGDCGHTEKRTMQAIEDPTFEPRTLPDTMNAIRDKVRRNKRLEYNPVSGMNVVARTKEAVYLRVNDSLRERTDYHHSGARCTCDFCANRKDQDSMWDTLCVPLKKPKKGNDYAHTVHMPEPWKFQEYMDKKEKEEKEKVKAE